MVLKLKTSKIGNMQTEDIGGMDAGKLLAIRVQKLFFHLSFVIKSFRPIINSY